MTSSQRILLNTLATYCRTVFAMTLGLFSSRWVLQALGEVDYGLMGVVGSVIIFITFLNNISSNSCARFFAYSIGKGNTDEVNHWFNTACSVHTILPVILIMIGYPIGVWAINSFLNIPSVRIDTVHWVFRFSLVSAFTGMLFSPYLGMFTAKQRIYEMSIWGVGQAIGMFTLAYILTCYKGDCWLLYSGGTVWITVVLGLCQVIRARRLFPECRIHFAKWWDMQKLKDLFSFAGWQLFGSLGWVLRGQGTAILLNKYFNPSSFPSINAAYGVGNNISGYTQMFSGAMLGAFTPEITASEGRGDREQMLLHANRASKFGTMLVLLFAIPLVLEINYVLVRWLKNPPDLAAMFCTLIIVSFIIDRLTAGQMLAVNAVGKIAGYQAMIGGFSLLTLPIAWFFLAFGYSAISVGWAFILTMAVMSAGRVIWAKYLVGASPFKWIKDVFVPCLVTTAVGLGSGVGVQKLFNDSSFYRLSAVGGITFISWVVIGWIVVLGESEKQFFMHYMRRRVQDVFHMVAMLLKNFITSRQCRTDDTPSKFCFIGICRKSRKTDSKNAIRLHYYRNELNFGDVLNMDLAQWLGIKVIVHSHPKICDAVFIGSVLEAFLARRICATYWLRPSYWLQSPVKIWGTGFITTPSRKNEKLYRRVEVYAVRGCYTLERLKKITGKDMDGIVLGDPGLLASYLINTNMIEKKYDLGIIPHYMDKNSPLMSKIKVKNAIIIDIKQSPSEVLPKIAQCKNILSSAMHGLIVADALGIPNVRMIAGNKMFGGDYKFDDYYSAFGIDCHYRVNLYEHSFTDKDLASIVENYKITKKQVADIQNALLDVFPFKNDIGMKIINR